MTLSKEWKDDLTILLTNLIVYLYIFSVFFRAVSWLRDSHGLFDYESRNIVKMSLKT